MQQMMSLLRSDGDRVVRQVLRAARRVRNAAEDLALRAGPFSYRAWLAAHEREQPPAIADGPVISIAMAGSGTHLEAAAASVLAQSYPHWELCVAAAGAPLPALPSDPRIRIVPGGGSGIAAALNRAAAAARGAYVALLDPNDTLAPHALAWMAAAIGDGAPDLLYTDETLTDSAGAPAAPVFKPDWSPDLLVSCSYPGSLLAVSRAAMEHAGWFREGYDGAHGYDLALRITDARTRVRHIPRVLYRRRRECPKREAERRALEDALRRRGERAAVEDGPVPGTWSVRRIPSGAALASIVICSRNPELLRACLDAIDARTSYANRETIVVQHGFSGDAGDRRLAWDGPFDFAAMNNMAAREAKGDVLVFLNDDVAPIAPGWLEALVAQAERTDVGIAGALLEYPDGTIQHAGIVMGIAGAAAHPLRGMRESPLWTWARLARNVSAVTGACLAVRKAVFEMLGGFDAAFPVNYNDVDLCLRARRAGYEVVLESRARLVHDEARTRDPRTSEDERGLLLQRWGQLLERGDPYYSPNLSRGRESPKLRW